jgi:hypothetical protein
MKGYQPRCEIASGSGCPNTAGYEYIRTVREAKDWPEGMPIRLCEQHAKDRIPLTKNQIKNLMKRIFPTILVLCLAFMGCKAQLLENVPTAQKAGYVWTVGPNGTSVAVPLSTLLAGMQGIKGDKGDKGDPGEQGPKGERGEKGDGLVVPDSIPNYWAPIVVDHKWQYVRANFNELHVAKNHLTSTTHLGECTADRDLYNISASGSINSISTGVLKVYYSFTDASGVKREGYFPDVSEVGAFSHGVIAINTGIGGQISVWAITDHGIDYNISVSVQQQ